MYQKEDNFIGPHSLPIGLGVLGVDRSGRLPAVVSTFHPYGGVWGQQGTINMPFGFTGEMEDENELVYLRSRYYSHATGTFLSQDPVEGSINTPMSLNQYAYAHGNPVNRTDPSGLSPIPNPQSINAMLSSNPLRFATMMNSGICEVSQSEPCIPGTPGCFSPAPTAPSPGIAITPRPAVPGTPQFPGLAPSPEGTVYGHEPYELWQYRVDLQREYAKVVFSQVAPVLADIGAGASALAFVAFVVSIPISGGVTAAIVGTVGTISGGVAFGSSALSALSYAAAGDPGAAAGQYAGIIIGPATGLAISGYYSLINAAFSRIPLVGRYFQGMPGLYEEFPNLEDVIQGFAANLYNATSYLSENPPEECPPWLLPRALCEPLP